mmetsp:Transcript_26081/g.81326  ORF Transcript_26081/g.81326 Transcript_26081/m.81326 type:complete len:208 (-) Transcript_26081:326-949(-)
MVRKMCSGNMPVHSLKTRSGSLSESHPASKRLSLEPSMAGSWACKAEQPRMLRLLSDRASVGSKSAGLVNESSSQPATLRSSRSGQDRKAAPNSGIAPRPCPRALQTLSTRNRGPARRSSLHREGTSPAPPNATLAHAGAKSQKKEHQARQTGAAAAPAQGSRKLPKVDAMISCWWSAWLFAWSCAGDGADARAAAAAAPGADASSS